MKNAYVKSVFSLCKKVIIDVEDFMRSIDEQQHISIILNMHTVNKTLSIASIVPPSSTRHTA